MSYIDIIKEKARSDRKTIVLPETNDKRTLIAASHIIEEGIANIIMVGNEEKIMDGAGWLEVDLTGVRVIDPTKCEKLDEYVQLLYETRKHKGMTPEKARQILLTDNMTFGVIMVKANDADGMVAGACHATADTLRPALQILKTAPGVKLVSGFFILDVPNCEYGEHGTFLFADCGLNQDPTAEELAAIADTSAKSFKTLVGAKPIIAMLSHSTKGSAKHPLVDKVVKAVEIAHEQYPGLTLDGELQTDAAIVPSVATVSYTHLYYTMTEKDAEYSYLALFAVTAGSVVSIELSGASGPSFVCNKPGGSYSFAIIKDPILNGKVNFRHGGTGDGHVFKLMIK